MQKYQIICITYVVILTCIGCSCSNTANRQQSDRGSEKLVKAIVASDIPLIESLLREGVNVNGSDSKGTTPLLQSLESGNEQVFDKLLEAGADPNICNASGKCVMNQAADRDGTWLFKALAHGGDPNAMNTGNKHSAGRTPLFYAISPNRADFESWQIRNVELLINAKADINHQDSQGCSPLLAAAQSGGYEIVVKLLLAGADPMLSDKHGQSTVDWFYGRTEDMVVRAEQKQWFRKAQEILSERDKRHGNSPK